MKQPFTVTCPDEDCAEEFVFQMDPEDDKDVELAKCPECDEEWEWEYLEGEGVTLILDPEFPPSAEGLEGAEDDEQNFTDEEEDEEDDY